MLEAAILRRKTSTRLKDATARLDARLGVRSWDFCGWKGYFAA